MSDFTVDEVNAAVRETDGWYELIERLEWGSREARLRLRDEDAVVTPVKSRGGGEGDGEERWVVFRVGDQFFRKDGYYASHYGTDWDGDLYEVKPREKTVTVYERVRG